MTEREIIERAIAGDRQAFGEIVCRHQASVFSTCLRLAGNAPDAEDLTHEALVEAWLKLRQLRDPERFAGWLKTLTLNVFRMWYRRRQHPTVELPEEIPAAEPDESEEPLHAAISSSLFRLSSTHRVVLVLHYLEGLSYEEIAAFLDIPIGTVMSRLHRARKALEGLVRDQISEDTPMSTPENLRQDVLAEIEVLLELFREKPETAERLSVILERSPERLGQLIKSSANRDALASIGALLPRLGPQAIRTALDAWLSSEPREAGNAAVVLEAAVARYQTLPWPGGPDRTADLQSYVFADALLSHPASAEAKARLLVVLIRAATDASVADLLVDLLLSDRYAATPLLLDLYRSMRSTEELFASRPILTALCRLRTPFCRELLSDLESGEGGRKLLAIAGVESVARIVDREGLADASDEQMAIEDRHGGALRSRDLDGSVMGAIRARLGALVGSEETLLRDAAIGALAALRDRAHLPAIRACLGNPARSTRMAAIRALANLGDEDAVPALLGLATSAEESERLAAIDALGHLKAWSAHDLLLKLADDPDESLQVAAIAALGELGGDEVEALLRRFTASGSPARRKAAAKALYRGTRVVPQRSELSRRVWERMRGPDARPFVDISLEATLRYALTENRPYDERELSQRIGRVCVDFSSVRRMLIELGVMTREDAVYELTSLGQAAWRVEQRIGR
jgi:RNA polymerase sigma-70 factor (ECF subfamily)